MIVVEQRASSVLFRVLSERTVDKPVLLAANACPVLPLTLAKARVPYELLDIDPRTLCLDTTAAMARLKAAPNAYGGVIFVRSYGFSEENSFFDEIKQVSPHLFIVDDRCLCAPEFWRPLPAPVDLSLYSTGYAKYVDLGWGGAGVVRKAMSPVNRRDPFESSALADITNRFKAALDARATFTYQDSAWLDLSEPTMPLADFERNVAEAQTQSAARKAELNALYSAGIPKQLQLRDAFQQWRFNILVDDVRMALEAITEAGLFASNHYSPLTGVFGQGEAPVTTLLHRHVVNLFNDRYFDAPRAKRIIDVVQRVCRPAPDDVRQLFKSCLLPLAADSGERT
jgi:hypothetical protein